MKVVFIQNVAGVARKGDVKDVKMGYWRNFLLPGGLAKEATPAVLKQFEEEKRREAETIEARIAQLAQAIKKLEKEQLVVEAKADEKGGLFAGIDEEKIADLIKEKLKLEIPAKFIKIEKPLKQIGVYDIPVKDTVLKLEVRAES